MAAAAGLAVVLAIIVGELAPAQPARADDDSPTVLSATIIAADGATSQASVTLDQLLAGSSACPVYVGPDDVSDNAPDGRQAGIALASNDGTDSGTWPLASALLCLQSNGTLAPVAVDSTQAVVVVGGDGAPEDSANALLHGHSDFFTPSDFQDPSQVPVLSAQNPGQNPVIIYNRPARNAGDINFSDEVSGASPIAVDVYEGQSPISVTINPPATTTVTAGTELSLSAQTSGGVSPVAYAWSFDGAAPSSTQPAPSIRLSTAGVYDIGLQVSDANGDVGQAAPIQVAVTSTTSQTQTTGKPTHGTTTPPAGGGRAATGPASGSLHVKTSTGGTKRSGGGAGTSGAAGSSTAATGRSAETGAEAAGASGSGAISAPPTSAAPGPPALSAPPAPTRKPGARLQSAVTPPSGRPTSEVSGLLISEPLGEVAPTDRTSRSAATASGRPEALRSASSASPAAVSGGALAAVVLVTLGMAREVLGPIRVRLRRRSSGLLSRADRH